MTREEALEILKVQSVDTLLHEAIITLHPELAESEDERMWKKIIDHFDWHSKAPYLTHQECDEIKAYLEKQKEQPTNEEMLRTLRAEYEKGVADTIAKYEQKEQKPAEWSEEYREEDLRTRFAFYTYKDEDDTLYLSNVFVEETSRNKGFGTKILKAAEKVAETIGASRICLKVKQNTSVNAWYRKHGYGYVTFEDDYDWLEKRLEYLKPKQEWSEEDERMLRTIISDGSRGVELDSKQISWLKSLRSRPKVSDNWKPSEEQMEAFHVLLGKVPRAPELYELYNDLKKLM